MVAAALAYDFGGDCGIYNVGTVEKARRRGLGTALTAAQVGFRDLGRILEYVPVEGER
jgi:ribosomal protein S18 acetylase RimI-like enzyme